MAIADRQIDGCQRLAFIFTRAGHSKDVPVVLAHLLKNTRTQNLVGVGKLGIRIHGADDTVFPQYILTHLDLSCLGVGNLIRYRLTPGGGRRSLGLRLRPGGTLFPCLV